MFQMSIIIPKKTSLFSVIILFIYGLFIRRRIHKMYYYPAYFQKVDKSTKLPFYYANISYAIFIENPSFYVAVIMIKPIQINLISGDHLTKNTSFQAKKATKQVKRCE